MAKLYLGLSNVIAQRNAMGPVCHRRGQTRIVGVESIELICIECLKGRGRPVGAVGRDVERHFETEGIVGSRLAVADGARWNNKIFAQLLI